MTQPDLYIHGTGSQLEAVKIFFGNIYIIIITKNIAKFAKNNHIIGSLNEILTTH